MAEAPPRFDALSRQPLRRKSVPEVFWIALAAAMLGLIAYFAMHWKLPLPKCWLREWTGIPCPACGCTRSLAAWATLDLAGALRFNPLFFTACVGLAFWTALRLAEGIWNGQVSQRIRQRVERLPLLRIALSLLAVNWVYLYLTLPR